MTTKKALYVVTHSHEYGADTHLLRADHLPSEAEVIAQFSLDYEPEKGEEIDIKAVNEETIVELGEKIQIDPAVEDPTFCKEHGCYFVECKNLGHGEDFDPRETL